MASTMDIQEFESREAASAAAAQQLAAALERRLDAHEEASLVVSGGTTPSQALEALAAVDLDRTATSAW